MALAKKCDRCGKFYENYPIGCASGPYNTIGQFQRTGYECIINSCDSTMYDLCQECMAEFEKFITSGGKCDDRRL